ncbi:ATP-dependent helicase [Roseomonas sp. USHLN139]|uniref:ATP-dependent helicase n=1 Tax=Roseomonas sp. USHLN139 TaxID=3081298 RepID=UPI003B01E8CC
MSDSHLDGLNPAQRAAVLAPAPQLVIAGAGSGKTETLARRVVDLISRRGEDPSRLLCITFTTKAAAEMRARLAQRLPPGRLPRWVGTFHAAMARLLIEDGGDVPGLPRGFSIMPQAEARRLLMQVAGLRDAQTGTALQEVISLLKGRLAKTPRGPAFARFEGALLDQAAALLPDYGKALAERAALDFDDLIALPVRAMRADPGLAARWQGRWSEILVDEFQDTNLAQHRLVKLLAGQGGRVFAVGDDAQSIYGWRGAAVAELRRFAEHYPAAPAPLRLETNYRSTRRILLAANAVAACDPEALRKTLRPADAASALGPPLSLTILETAEEEGRAVARRLLALRKKTPEMAWRDAAVLLRASFLADPLLQGLREAGIPAGLVAEREPEPPREILAAQAWLRLALSWRDGAWDPAADDAFRRACAMPARGLSGRLFARLRDHAAGAGLALAAAIPSLPATEEERAPLQAVAETARAIADRLAAQRPSPADALQLAAIGAGLADGLRQASPDRLAAWEAAFAAAARSGSLPAYADALALGSAGTEAEAPDAVALMTLHRAKGLEFDHVLLPGLEDGVFPHFRAEAQGSLDEERRLFYVGLTRARKTLWLSWVRHRRDWAAKPSRFLAEIPPQLFRAVA